MRLVLLLLSFSFSILFAQAQPALVKEIDHLNSPDLSLSPLNYLASDELMGRATTRPEILIAARYIGDQFKSFGLKQLSGTENFAQNFQLKIISPSTNGSLVIGSKTYQMGADLLQSRGAGLNISAPVIFAGFGSPADLANLDLKGKIVVVNMGENDSTTVMGANRFRDAKQKLVQEKGAIALIERYWQSAEDWEMPTHYFTSQRAFAAQDSLLPVFIVHDPEGGLLPAVKSSATATINVAGNKLLDVPAKNVMGWVEGTDPQLKNQFLVLSAHYDHLGVSSSPKMVEGKLDSIYNGTRDNAIGVAAVINAARYFARHPAKRSVLFIAFTAEELGLLGSKYFVAHPPLALEKIVCNLNIDNGGFNDSTQVNLLGLARTSVDKDLEKACQAYGFALKGDPAPQMGLFDRSDNVNFAAKGVPAPTFGMGVSKLDESIMRFYHQPGDEINTIDLNYVIKYMKSYILAAKYIADNPAQPQWLKGDKYEAAWKQLYSKP